MGNTQQASWMLRVSDCTVSAKCYKATSLLSTEDVSMKELQHVQMQFSGMKPALWESTEPLSDIRL